MKTCLNRLVFQAHVLARNAVFPAVGNIWFWFLGLLLIGCCLRPALASEGGEKAAPQVVGEVVFVAGEASLQRNGQWQGLQKGRSVQEGDAIRTTGNGHVHLRMYDHGFIAVRPESTLEIRQYSYNPDDPSRNRVQLHLQQGVARTVSGKAGETNRDQYRFTTPVAAIGLRGTDYVVHSASELTRVSVLKGAVTVSPLGNGCSMDLQSFCGGSLARELAALNPNAYLEVRRQGNGAQVILREDGKDNPNRVSPPKNEEPKALLDAGVTSTRIAETLEQAGRAPKVQWGRWSYVATSTPTLASLKTPDMEFTVTNQLFGLLRSTEQVVLPQGAFAMTYSAGEAWVSGSGGKLSAASLSDARLNLDFYNREFQTSLVANMVEGSQQFQAQGKITEKGFLYSDKAASSMNVSGVIANQAQEAGYLFDAKVPGGTLVGVTHWRR